MEFLVKECLEITWYYSPAEITLEVNKESINTKIHVPENRVKNTIDFIKNGYNFLKIKSSVSSYYSMEEKKQALIFSIAPENKELVNYQIQGLFDFIIEKLSNINGALTQEDIANQAYYLEEHFNKKKFTEYLDNKLPVKENVLVKKLKL